MSGMIQNFYCVFFKKNHKPLAVSPFFEPEEYLLKIKALRNLMALQAQERCMKVGNGILKEVNQEPGNEESGTCDIAEEAGKVGLVEVATCGTNARRWELCSGAL